MDAIVMCRLTVGKISNGSVNSPAPSAFLTARPFTLTTHNEMSDSPPSLATHPNPPTPLPTHHPAGGDVRAGGVRSGRARPGAGPQPRTTAENLGTGARR